jgi:hypothetical protein
MSNSSAFAPFVPTTPFCVHRPGVDDIEKLLVPVREDAKPAGTGTTMLPSFVMRACCRNFPSRVNTWIRLLIRSAA